MCKFQLNTFHIGMIQIKKTHDVIFPHAHQNAIFYFQKLRNNWGGELPAFGGQADADLTFIFRALNLRNNARGDQIPTCGVYRLFGQALFLANEFLGTLIVFIGGIEDGQNVVVYPMPFGPSCIYLIHPVRPFTHGFHKFTGFHALPPI